MQKIKSQMGRGLLCSTLLTSFAYGGADDFVGDGFGGREWYVPSKIKAQRFGGALIDPSGQLIIWGSTRDGIFPVPDSSVNPVSVIAQCPYEVAAFDDVALLDYNTLSFHALVAATPVFVTGDVIHATACDSHAVFAKSDGTVWSVGSNTFGGFGDGTTNTSVVTSPVQMQLPAGKRAVRVKAFGSTATQAQSNANLLYRGATVVLCDDGTVYVAGGGGSIGGTTTANSLTPVQKNISDVVAIHSVS